MNCFTKALVISLFIFAQACDSNANSQSADEAKGQESGGFKLPFTGDKAKKNDIDLSTFETIEWTELIPKEELDVLLNPPAYIADIADGSSEDQISSQLQNALAAPPDDAYQQALVSRNVIAEMNNKPVKLPGFVVPLEFNDDQTVTEFFLVPYFGACIHTPPPPPNQIIHITYPEGFQLESLYTPIWVFGNLETAITENQLATSAYSIKMQAFEEYRGINP